MTIDWTAFTPWSALPGGVLTGVAAAMYALLNGRIAGISGILGGLLKPATGDIAWRAAFLLGLVASLARRRGRLYGCGLHQHVRAAPPVRVRSALMLLLTSRLAGLVFGRGLIVSGMANPAKVIGFLDLAGAWDPSLAQVMVGAIAVDIVAFAVARRRTVSFIGAQMKLSTMHRTDRRLVLGSVLFGVGWGRGVLPRSGFGGPWNDEAKAVAFVAAILAGMSTSELLEHRKRTAALRAAGQRPTMSGEEGR